MAAQYSVGASRRLIVCSATGALAGIALGVAGAPGGSLLTVASLVALIVAVHRLGRTGPDRAGVRHRPRRRRVVAD